MTKEEILKNYTGEKMTPGKAMRAYCLDCCAGSRKEIKLCPSTDCSLYPFRLGKNPYLSRPVNNEQREALRMRLAKMRESKDVKV